MADSKIARLRKGILLGLKHLDALDEQIMLSDEGATRDKLIEKRDQFETKMNAYSNNLDQMLDLHLRSQVHNRYHIFNDDGEREHIQELLFELEGPMRH